MNTITKETCATNAKFRIYPCVARRIAFGAMCLALCMVLPFLTGQIPQIGSMLSPMHIPVLLAGFLCGGWWAALIGAVAPILRFALFGMPPIFPVGLTMCFELAAYGLLSGMLFQRLPKKAWGVYASLILAMLGGRIVWGIVAAFTYPAAGMGFGWQVLLASAFVNAVPGIILHIVMIPPLVLAMRKSNFIH